MAEADDDVLGFTYKQVMQRQEEYVSYLSRVRQLYLIYTYEQHGELTDDQLVELNQLKQRIDDLYQSFPDDVKANYTPAPRWWIS